MSEGRDLISNEVALELLTCIRADGVFLSLSASTIRDPGWVSPFCKT